MKDRQDSSIPEEDVLLTISEVAHKLRVDDTTVRRWVTKGALKAVVLPHVNERKAYRIPYSVLLEILQTGATPN